MRKVTLRVVGGKQHGQTIPLSSDKFLIGRGEDCHLRPNSELVSRHHCVFHVDDYTVRLRDLGSTNGTTVAGEKIKGEVQLQGGERIRIGKLDYEFEVLIFEESEQVPAAGEGVEPGTEQPVSTETAEFSTSDTVFEMPSEASVADTNAAAHDTSVFKTPDPVEQPPENPQAPPQPQQPAEYQQPPPQYVQQPMPGNPQQPLV